MIGILSGDRIIFEENGEPANGYIVVGRFIGIVMCICVCFGNERGRFRREDGETPGIVTQDYVIFGIMVGLARNCRKAG